MLENPTIFLDKMFQGLEKLEIDLTDNHLDHLCYRVSTEIEYQEKKEELLKDNLLLIESCVNGRLISTFKLNQPIKYKSRIIDVIELPSPKKNTQYITGFEHVEFVIKESFDEFIKKYPHVNFDTISANKDFNPEIRVEIDQNISIKFHHLPLEKVIEIEKQNLL